MCSARHAKTRPVPENHQATAPWGIASGPDGASAAGADFCEIFLESKGKRFGEIKSYASR